MEGLPKALARNPYVRALGMKVHPLSRRELVVIGGSIPHTVTVANNHLICDCTAAQFKSHCAHILAVLALKEKPDMAFTVDRPTGRPDEPKELPVPLPRRTVYGGILLGYSKEYDKTDYKTKRPVIDDKTGKVVRQRTFRFLATHTAGGDKWIKLTTLTEAKAKINMKWFCDPKTGVMSPLFQIVQSISGLPAEALQDMTDSEIGEAIDNAVGGACAFLAQPVTKEQGYIGNFIDAQSFEKPDAHLAALGEAMQAKLDFAYTENEDEPRRYVRSPKGQTQPSDAPVSSAPVGDEDLSGEVPF
jgi:hypothetical protein